MRSEYLLGVDFSTSQRSMAVISLNEGTFLFSTTLKQDEPVLARLEQTLEIHKIALNQIAYIAVGVGPGSYTGIRCAISFATGCNLAIGCKLVAVSSVKAMLRQIAKEDNGAFSVLIDAQRNEYYRAESNHEREDIPEEDNLSILSSEEATKIANAYGPDLKNKFPNIKECYPDAKEIAFLAKSSLRTVEPEDLRPIYIRPVQFAKWNPS